MRIAHYGRIPPGLPRRESRSSSAILNKNIRVRLVVQTQSEVRELERLLNRMVNKKDRDVLSRDQISIVRQDSVLREVSPATLMVTSTPLSVQTGIKVFATDRYGNGKTVVYVEGGVTYAKQFLAAIQSTLGENLEWLAQDNLRQNIYRPRDEESLLALALQIVISQLAIEAEAELERARAA